MKNKFYIGCVADDFTGAGDVASFFVKAGLVTVLYNGIPDDSHTVAEGTQAVVIALKSRTQDTLCVSSLLQSIQDISLSWQ